LAICLEVGTYRVSAQCRPPRHVEGEVLAMAMYAGESVDAVKNVKPAKDIVAELIPQATRSS
jgi:hypothetical protein